MNDFLASSPGGAYQEAATLAKESFIQRPSPLDRLKRRRDDVQRQLTDLNAAIDALESNPQVNAVLEVLAKVQY